MRPAFEFEFEATGTRWRVETADCGEFGSYLALEWAVKETVRRFENKYSRFVGGSLVDKLAHRSGDYELDAEVKPMFDMYFLLEKLSGGLFTPLIGSTLDESGYDKDYSFVKKPFTKIPRLGQVCDYKFPKLRTLAPLRFDFGAIGKGMIVDIVGEALSGQGVENFCVDAGGDIKRVSSDGSWISVGLEHPENHQMAVGIYKLGSGSVCGSSGNRRKWGNCHHILNPFTHMPAGEVTAVWVAAETAAMADGLSTALFWVEPEVLAGNFNFEYVVVYQNMTVRKSEGGSFELFYESS